MAVVDGYPDLELAAGADGGTLGITIDREYLGNITKWDSFQGLMANPKSATNLTSLVEDFAMPGRFIKGAHLQKVNMLPNGSRFMTSAGALFEQDAKDVKRFGTTFVAQMQLQTKSNFIVISQGLDAAGKPIAFLTFLKKY